MKHTLFLPIGSIILDRDTSKSYVITDILGQGGFAQCYSVLSIPNNHEFAAKIIKKSELVRPKNKQKLLSEIKIHLSVNHKNIVKLHTYFEDEDFVYLLMEMCHNKSVMDLLKKRKTIEEKYVRVFLLQILSALDYLHNECSVVHRDMKLANLFLDRNFNIKVGDFGLAAVIDKEERKKTICGTPNYIAPEVLFNSATGHSYEVDIWSVGVIVYTMIIGKPPFQKSDVKEIYKCIKTNSYTYPADAKISHSARVLIAGLLELDPQKRLTLSQIYQSDFIRDVSTELNQPPTTEQENTRPSYQSRLPDPTLSTTATTTTTTTTIPSHSQPTQPIQTMPPPSTTTTTTTYPNYFPPSTKPGLLSSVLGFVLSLLDQPGSYLPISTSCPNDYVVHTIDTMSKYGIGYILASGTVGILFNDCTSLVLRSLAVAEVRSKQTSYSFEYMEHKTYGKQKIITREKHQTSNAPAHLKKKILLTPYFVEALFEHFQFSASNVDESVFVIKHVNFTKGPVLRLSNRTIVFIINESVLVFYNEGQSLFAGGRPQIDRHQLIYCQQALNVLLKK
ncbi:polo-like kinase 1 [Nematocida homosporus]|uniref:polo-like kinase 1 n=1 Tax=Nematocida homosporus TaxID=1912981 RepID=UPI00221E90A3|nr:polo-like kinase 1 [Nematocida homosporus]KAI5187997.1 polo-like kinase 1 [Nematocida homosporus]